MAGAISPGTGPGAARLANLAAPILLILTPFLGYLRFNDYPLWRPEILICTALLLTVGGAIGGIIALRPATLRPSLVAVLLVVFVDMQIDTELERLETMIGLFSDRTTWPDRRSVTLAGLFAVFAVLTWILRRHLSMIIDVSFAVIVVSTLVLPVEQIGISERAASGSGAAPELPPLVHIVLDEQIGIDGVPEEVPGADKLRRDLMAFYERYGFTLYTRAFSHFSDTNDSLSNMLNGVVTSRHGEFIEVSGRDMALKQNDWFRVLADRGYRIRVYQANYMDFCQVEGIDLGYCLTYSISGVSSLADAEIDADGKARVILGTYLITSNFYEGLRWFYTYRLRPRLSRFADLPEWNWERTLGGSLASLAVLDRIVADVAAAPRGTAFFGHVLLPHYPYVVDAECRVKREVGAWLRRHRISPPAPSVNTPESRATRYALYFDQVRCVHRRLAALFEVMDRNGVFDTATILVHGDHGSRISRVYPVPENARRLSRADLVDNFSTLFAVRMPGLAAGAEPRMRSIQSLFTEILLRRSPPGDDRSVFLAPWPRVVGAPLLATDFAGFGDR